MSFIVSRYKEFNGIKDYLQVMDAPGSPFQSRADAEDHLKRVMTSFHKFNFKFEVRDIGEKYPPNLVEQNYNIPTIEETVILSSAVLSELSQFVKKTYFRKFYERVLPTIKNLFGVQEKEQNAVLLGQKQIVVPLVSKHRNRVSCRIFKDGIAAANNAQNYVDAAGLPVSPRVVDLDGKQVDDVEL
jgi:hypothetical protein